MKKNKITIAIVSDAIYPYNKGGKEKRIFEISTRLAKSGYKVCIYCMKWWKGSEKQRVENGVTLKALSKFYPLYSGRRRSIRQAVLFAFACLRLFKEDFDVLEVDHMPYFVIFATKLVAMLKRKKLFVTWNEVWGLEYWKEYLGVFGYIAFGIEWVSARLPDEIISVSAHTKERLQKYLKIKKPIYVVPNGIDIKKITKVKPAKEQSDIIFAGRLLSHKKVDLLLRVIANVRSKFPKVKTFVIGDGPEKEKLKVLAKQLGIEKNVRFFDFLENHNSLYALMKSSKVFVFPSIREGFGIAALEANACNIPVVTVNAENNATKYLITNGKNGYVTYPTEGDLYQKVLLALSNKKNNSYFKTIEKYDWNNIKENIIEVYKR